MDNAIHTTLAVTWFGLIGLMLAFYVVTDGFDLGIGILSLLRTRRDDHDVMVQSIGHVWDANETWLVVLGGALFGAFPEAYARLLQDLYLPVMALIAGLIMRGSAIEFRHSATHGPLWDKVFGIGSLIAAIAQGVVLGKVIMGLLPGELSGMFVTVSAVGVVAGYSLLGATYLVNKTVGALEQWARRLALLSAFVTVAAAALLTAATWFISEVGHDRWTQRGVFHLLIGLGAVAAFAFAYVVGSLYLGRSRAISRVGRPVRRVVHRPRGQSLSRLHSGQARHCRSGIRLFDTRVHADRDRAHLSGDDRLQPLPVLHLPRQGHGRFTRG